MKLDLPKTSTHDVTRQESYTLFITKDETLYLNEEPIPLKNLPDRLKKISSETEEGIVLKADEKTRYGFVVEVMDLVKQSGIKKLVVATQPKD